MTTTTRGQFRPNFGIQTYRTRPQVLSSGPAIDPATDYWLVRGMSEEDVAFWAEEARLDAPAPVAAPAPKPARTYSRPSYKAAWTTSDQLWYQSQMAGR